jgi:hypothetical protein
VLLAHEVFWILSGPSFTMKHAKMLTGVTLMALAAGEDLTQHVDILYVPPLVVRT